MSKSIESFDSDIIPATDQTETLPEIIACEPEMLTFLPLQITEFDQPQIPTPELMSIANPQEESGSTSDNTTEAEKGDSNDQQPAPEPYYLSFTLETDEDTPEANETSEESKQDKDGLDMPAFVPYESALTNNPQENPEGTGDKTTEIKEQVGDNQRPIPKPYYRSVALETDGTISDIVTTPEESTQDKDVLNVLPLKTNTRHTINKAKSPSRKLLDAGNKVGNDKLVGSTEINTVSYLSAKDGVSVDLEKREAKSIVNHDAARIGKDSLKGFKNVIATKFSDEISGNREANHIEGRNGNDRLLGFGGNDILLGGAGDDVLHGHKGNDILTGGLGADRLHGGKGQDTFRYVSADDSRIGKKERDIIFGFNKKEGDRIDLSAIDTDLEQSGDQAFRFIGGNAFSGALGEVRFTKGILQINIDSDINADMEIKMVGTNNFGEQFLIL